MEMKYVALNVIIKEKITSNLLNMKELEQIINSKAAEGYKLHTANVAPTGETFFGGVVLRAILIFEKI